MEKKVKKTEKKHTPKTSFDYTNSEVIFSDILEINLEDDVICIGLATKNRDRKRDKNLANVSHRLYLTLGHFFRVVDVASGVKEDILNQIKKEQEKNRKG